METESACGRMEGREPGVVNPLMMFCCKKCESPVQFGVFVCGEVEGELECRSLSASGHGVYVENDALKCKTCGWVVGRAVSETFYFFRSELHERKFGKILGAVRNKELMLTILRALQLGGAVRGSRGKDRRVVLLLGA